MAQNDFDCIVRVFDKHMNLIAQFDGNTEGYTEEEMQNLMICPRVTIAQNGESTLTFQMLAGCEKWQAIKGVENIYSLNGRYYTALNENAYKYEGDGSIRTVTVTLVETFYLLSRQFHQVYNAGLYVYAKASFIGWSGISAMFRVNASDCSNPGNTISSQNAWNQVKLWQATDKKGNNLTYTVIKNKENAPTNWENAPATLSMTSISVSGNSATLYMTARASQEVQQHYDYKSGGTYKVESRPYPPALKEVWVNSTITTDTTSGTQTTRRIVTSNKKSNYSYNSNTGQFSIRYSPSSNEEINYIIAVYDYYDMGEISNGATCTFAYGAEMVDDHTFLVLPKADTKYKLTIDGIEYEDNQVKDSRGALLPRGSGGYALWAALKGTGWTLGICDVLAKGFDPTIDYGVFNIESDMKDTLYNIQLIQSLYGGILDFDSKQKIVNYRAENSKDYDSFNDGFNEWTGYEFREGKNIIDQPNVVYDNDIITKAYILGYGNLNIKKVNGGKSYVEDYSYTTDVYEGYLNQPLIYDTNDEGGQRQLLYWGQKEIKSKSRPRMTISINATDIRTSEGHEHEVFNINDVVKCYIKNKHDDTDVVETKRIIKWSYNAFALWDCTVELGDKTANFSEIFKLIYNAAIEEAPKTNAAGKISSDEIVMEIDLSELGFEDVEIGGFDLEDYEYPNTPISDYYPSISGTGGSIYNNNLTDYISLIARKTTSNTDAISGLIIEANELYAQSELFATYQNRTDDLISDTYSGLKVYADEGMSKITATVEGNYQATTKAIEQAKKEAKDDFIAVQSYAQSGFQAQQSQNQAFAQQFSNVNTTLYNHGQQIQANVNSIAQCVTYADAQRSYAALTADYTAQISTLQGQLQQTIQSQARFEAEANSKFATTSQLSSYATIDHVTGEISKSEASIKTYASQNFASASISAKVNDIGSTLSVANTHAYLYAGKYHGGAYILLDGYNLSLVCSGSLTIKGNSVSFFTKTIDGTTIRYLGTQ